MGNPTLLRFPSFECELVTENSSYIITYDLNKELTSNDFENSIISFSTKNSMQDDTPVFSIIISAKEKWDNILGPNDLIRLKAIPDTKAGEPENPVILVGLISDVHKEGEYNDGVLLYRITGKAMAKALTDFEVGVIQEVSAIISNVGWLPDDPETGLDFSGNTAAGIGEELMDKFVFEYANYYFAGGRTLDDFFIYEFESWTEDESLSDTTPFINYQGSLRQFLEDIAAKPFNEIYFEYTPDGKCKAIMRPTPFDPDKWDRLPTYGFTSETVLEESFGKSDSEMYSVYVVQPPNAVNLTTMDLGVFPKFHPDLINKYGYKRLDAKNRYLLSSHVVDMHNEQGDGPSFDDDEQLGIPDEDNTGIPSYDDVMWVIEQNGYDTPEELEGMKDFAVQNILSFFPDMADDVAEGIVEHLSTDTFTENAYLTLIAESGDTEEGEFQGVRDRDNTGIPTYEELMDVIESNDYNDPETLRNERNFVNSNIKSFYPDMPDSLVTNVIDSLIEESFNEESYLNMVASSGANEEMGTEANNEKDVATEKVEEYTQRLFNWYCENANFYSGDIRVLGNTNYRVGSRVFYRDYERNTTWEFYVESVQHEFSFTNGFVTILGVTRGLPNNGESRFTNLWGKSQDFKGGYLGEPSIAESIENAQETSTSGATGSFGNNAGGNIAMSALATGRTMLDRPSIYDLGGGRQQQSPFATDPIIVDCSSFIWWCYYENGIALKGGKTGMTTDTIRQDPRFVTMSERGSDVNQAIDNLVLGDLVYFDTYKNYGHVGIYNGNGTFIGAQSSSGISEADMNNSYWAQRFKGHVLRYRG